METHRVCGHCGKSLGEKTFKDHKRLYYHEGRWIKQKELLPQDESTTTSSLCSEPSMDTRSHASSELHNEGDGMARSENAVKLNLLHLERCMIAFLMLILLTSPKVAKHNNCCNVVPSLNNPNQFKASTYVHINN